MMSLFDYQGHADKDGTGLKVNAYAQLRNAPNKKRKLNFGTFRTVFLYEEKFLDEYFKVQEIFNTELIVK
tara:strand:+ start:703 stop:912 length:210 start_codon:yes stop_codon:yes gene_type:complete